MLLYLVTQVLGQGLGTQVSDVPLSIVHTVSQVCEMAEAPPAPPVLVPPVFGAPPVALPPLAVPAVALPPVGVPPVAVPPVAVPAVPAVPVPPVALPPLLVPALPPPALRPPAAAPAVPPPAGRPPVLVVPAVPAVAPPCPLVPVVPALAPACPAMLAVAVLLLLLPQALNAMTDSRHVAATKECFMVMVTPSANKQFKDLRSQSTGFIPASQSDEDSPECSRASSPVQVSRKELDAAVPGSCRRSFELKPSAEPWCLAR